MTEEHNTQPMAHQLGDEDPIGEMKLPGRPTFGARVMALAGSTAGLGFALGIGAASTDTWTPTPWTR